MSVRIVVRQELDQDPDLSWLEQTDEQMGEGFEAAAKDRELQFVRGHWHMVGVIASASVPCSCGEATKEATDSLWGIESDSDEGYLIEVAEQCAGEVAAELGVEDYEIDWRQWHEA